MHIVESLGKRFIGVLQLSKTPMNIFYFHIYFLRPPFQERTHHAKSRTLDTFTLLLNCTRQLVCLTGTFADIAWRQSMQIFYKLVPSDFLDGPGFLDGPPYKKARVMIVKLKGHMSWLYLANDRSGKGIETEICR